MCGCPRLHFVHYYRILQISKSNMYIVHKYMSCVNIYTLYYIYIYIIYTYILRVITRCARSHFGFCFDVALDVFSSAVNLGDFPFRSGTG